MTEEELENIIDNMYELQRKRILSIQENNIEGLEIKDIMYVGKIKAPGIEEGQVIEKEIYLSIEEKDGKIAYKYYDENQELLGIECEEKYIPSEKYMNKKETMQEIKELGKEGVSLKEIEEKEKETKKNQNTKNKEEKKNPNIEIPLEQEITSKITKKEETDLNQIQQGETLRNLLGLSGEYTKIVLVSSSQVNSFLPPEQRKTNMDCFIAVKENGESIVLGEDILKYDERSGTNPIEENATINIDGRVENEKVTSRYKIMNGNGNQYLSVGYDESVGKEVKFSEWSNQYGTYIDTELETNRITEGEVNKDVRKEGKRKTGIDSANDKQEKFENEKENGCEETDITKVDNDPNNDSHEHISEERLKEEANKAKVSIEAFKEEFEKAPGETLEEKIKNAHEAIEEQFIGSRGNR